VEGSLKSHCSVLVEWMMPGKEGALSMSEHNEIFALKILLVVFLILNLATTSFLSLRIIELQRTLDNQTSQINKLSRQVSQMRDELSFLEGEIQSLPSLFTTSLSEIYSEVKDSIVVVRGKIVEETPFGEEYISVQGSGFVYNYSGKIIIVTNNHVVDRCINITVSFLNGETYQAEIIGKDSYSDLAVLSTDAPPSELKPLTVTSSSSLKVGQTVIAVGSPFGLAGSMTVGVISQLGRTISESATGGYLIADVIQTSAPINPGNSGGPLLNILGEVIGITTAIVKDSQGVGFAIPSDTLLRELPYLIKGEQYPHPWLGVKGINMNFDIAKVMNLNVTYGWLIVEVLTNSPAEKAGLRGGTHVVNIDGTPVKIGGDVIIMINGTRIRNGDDLATYLERNTEPNQSIQITVIRLGQMLNVTVTLGVRPIAG